MNLLRNERRADHFVLVLLLVLVFLVAARTPLDTDLYWHLAAGQQTWQTGRPMVTDVFSFTRLGQPWINHSWLSQVILYGLYQLGGNLALGAWVAALATLSMAMVFVQMRGSAIFRAFLIVLAVTVAAVVWSPRPQLVSLVFFAMLGWILYRYKWRKINQLWLLPLLFLLWSNLHGGWALGFMSIAVMVCGETCNHLLGNPAQEVLSWRDLGRLLLWSGISVVALVIHPNGLEILKIPFQTVEVQVLQQFIQEWASPDFHELYQQPYLWLMLAVIVSFGLSGRKVDITDLLTVLWFGALGFIARRNYGPFALAAAPVLSRYLWVVFESMKNPPIAINGIWGPGPDHPQAGRVRPRWQRITNLILVGIFIFAAILKLWIVTYPALVETNAVGTYPVEAVKILLQNQGGSRVFNEYNWGGYLIWTDPQLKVFVDGRTDLYGDEILGEWLQMIQSAKGWQEKLSQWQVDWVLIDPTRPLANSLKSAGWEITFQDDHSILFRSPH